MKYRGAHFILEKDGDRGAGRGKVAGIKCMKPAIFDIAFGPHLCQGNFFSSLQLSPHRLRRSSAALGSLTGRR